MRLAPIAGAFALLTSVSIADAQTAPQKFAYVNSQALLQAAPGRAEAEVAFQKEFQSLEGQAKKLADSLQVLTAAFQKEEPGLSPQAREARLKTLRDRESEFEGKMQQLREQAQQREQDLMQPIIENIKKALEDFRSENGYTFIFDVAQGSMIVAADKNLDVTDRVMAKLKLSAPKAPPRTTGPAPAAAGVTKKPPPQ